MMNGWIKPSVWSENVFTAFFTLTILILPSVASSQLFLQPLTSPAPAYFGAPSLLDTVTAAWPGSFWCNSGTAAATLTFTHTHTHTKVQSKSSCFVSTVTWAATSLRLWALQAHNNRATSPTTRRLDPSHVKHSSSSWTTEGVLLRNSSTCSRDRASGSVFWPRPHIYYRFSKLKVFSSVNLFHLHRHVYKPPETSKQVFQTTRKAISPHYFPFLSYSR